MEFLFRRLGIAIAQPPLIQILTNAKAPYNISAPTAQIALSALSPPAIASMKKKIGVLKSQRERLLSALASPMLTKLGVGKTIGGNEANFLLVPILERSSGNGDEGSKERKPDSTRAQRVYKTLAEQEGVVVRYRGSEPGCSGCLRITVGTEEENTVVIKKLEELLNVI
jgi:histidinol-phosphate aminotransferase